MGGDANRSRLAGSGQLDPPAWSAAGVTRQLHDRPPPWGRIELLERRGRPSFERRSSYGNCVSPSHRRPLIYHRRAVRGDGREAMCSRASCRKVTSTSL